MDISAKYQFLLSVLSICVGEFPLPCFSQKQHFVGKGDSKGERRFLCPGVFSGDTHSLLTGRIQRNQRFRGTRFSEGKSSVLYLCGADGSRNCSHPGKCGYQLRYSDGKGFPLRGSISGRKRLAGGADMHCLRRCEIFSEFTF